MPTTAEKVRDFMIDMEKIDLYNIDFFLFDRKELSNGERDKLTNHYKFEVEGNKARFGFNPGSAVPLKIRKQCFAKFAGYFPDGDIVGGVFEK